MIWHEKELDDRHKDPRNWKWGIFYYNKKDERLFVPKKNPEHGSTVNFARRASILVFLGPLLLLLILAVVFLVFSP